MAKAEAAGQADVPDRMSIPDEPARREQRPDKLAEARAKIAARAKEPTSAGRPSMKPGCQSGEGGGQRNTPRGRESEPPVEAPLATDQINPTTRRSAPPAPDDPTPSKQCCISCRLRGSRALCLAQADARAGVRHYLVGARLPAVPAARALAVRGERHLVTMAFEPEEDVCSPRCRVADATSPYNAAEPQQTP